MHAVYKTRAYSANIEMVQKQALEWEEVNIWGFHLEYMWANCIPPS